MTGHSGNPTSGSNRTSPLGGPAAVADALSQHPELVSIINDLELVVTPSFDEADAQAIQTQQTIKRFRLIEITGGVLIATLAIIGLARDEWWWGAAAGTVAGITAVVSVRSRHQDLEHWLDHRRIAEELRSLYFTVLTSEVWQKDSDRRRHLRGAVDRIVAPEWKVGADDAAQAANESGGVLEEQAWDLYRTSRLRDQISWMEAKSQTVKTRSQTLGRMQTGFLIGAALCGLLIAVVAQTDSISNAWATWLAVFVAASAGLVSFAAAADSVVASERLAKHYSRTASRLQLIDRTLGPDVGSADDVAEIESVLLAEHRSWHRLTQGNHQ